MVVWAVSGGRRISIYSAHMGRGARILLLEGGHDGMEVGRLGWEGGGTFGRLHLLISKTSPPSEYISVGTRYDLRTSARPSVRPSHGK